MKPFTCIVLLFFIHHLLGAQCVIEQLLDNSYSCCNVGQQITACSNGAIQQVQFKTNTVENNPSTATFFMKGDINNCEVLWTVPNIPISSNSIISIDLANGSGIGRGVVAGEAYQLYLIPDNGFMELRGPFSDEYPDGYKTLFFNCQDFSFDLWFRVSISTALPVELSGFLVFESRKSNAVQLNFSTVSESNTSHFTIQHSTNGTDFRDIGEVAAHGTTAEPHSYEFTHDDPALGDNYYRLKIVDYDGGFSYSGIEEVQLGGGESGIGIFPNPVLGDFTVRFNQPTESYFTASLFDLSGKPHFSLLFDAGTTGFSVPANGLPAGIYHLKIVDELGRVQWKKVVKAE